jgi:mercuric reductase
VKITTSGSGDDRRVPGILRAPDRSGVQKTARRDFDLAVLGAGSAGFAAAIRGAELDARVALIESGTLGGTCVNVGCVPSKTLIRAAEALHQRSHHGFAGVPATYGTAEWSLIRSQKNELVNELRSAKYVDVLRSYEGVTLIRGRAVVRSGPSVEFEDGRAVTARRLIVTTGASPWAPPIPGLENVPYLDSTSAMALERLPESMIVIGGSAVGLELAQMFARLGVRVTVLEAMPRVLPGEAIGLGEALADHLRDEGIAVRTAVHVKQVTRPAMYCVQFEAEGELREVCAEQLLVATGRRANTSRLGLEEVGVALGAKGEIRVDQHLRTSNHEIYAAGDVTGDPMFVYVAALAGTTAAENALNGDTRRYDLTALPKVTFTAPAVASVGLTVEAAEAAGIQTMVSQLPLEYVPRALAARDTRGFIQLVADASTRRLVGAHILASEAGEMITEPAMAIRFGLTIDDLTSSFHPYLTLSEGIKLAAQTFDRDVAKLSCCAA